MSHTRSQSAATSAMAIPTVVRDLLSITLFDSLEDWATNQGLAGPRIWMGIGHDAPGTTRPRHLRFDAALVVPAAFTPRALSGTRCSKAGNML